MPSLCLQPENRNLTSEIRVPGAERRYIPRGLLLQWHVTERCNLRCAHCYQEYYGGEELGFPDLLRILDQFNEVLDGWTGEAGPRPPWGHITVTGGEPFVRRDFLDLLEAFAASRKRFSFAILTNGSAIDAPLARRLHRLGPTFVQVSVEGAPATHDRIRGRGNFDRTVAAIRHLVGEGIRTLISFTAHRYNFREFPEVARLGRRLGVARVWADRLIPSGQTFSQPGQLSLTTLTPEETREFLEIMHRARTEVARGWFGRTEVAMRRALQFLMAGGRPYHCTAGDTLLTVLPNGDVYPCRRMPIRVGNLQDTPLAELYYQSDLLCALRDQSRVSEGCQGCCFARLCRGGLKCLAYAATGDPFRADPGCWLASTRRKNTELSNLRVAQLIGDQVTATSGPDNAPQLHDKSQPTGPEWANGLRDHAMLQEIRQRAPRPAGCGLRGASGPDLSGSSR
jgi:radical SAM protein with 4Fe4S-binding SPASM domain